MESPTAPPHPQVRARDLQPGDLVDIPEPFTKGTDNDYIARFEYARIESVNGGWFDAAARPNELVLYVPNWVAPVILPANAEVTLVVLEAG